MTLQKLTDILQTWCHQGHSQNEILFLTSAGLEEADGAEVHETYEKGRPVVVLKTGVGLL